MSETITTLRARLAEATKGPFEVRTSCASPYVSHVIDRDHEDVAEVRRAEDAHLFADAVSSLPLLLAVAEIAGAMDLTCTSNHPSATCNLLMDERDCWCDPCRLREAVKPLHTPAAVEGAGRGTE